MTTLPIYQIDAFTDQVFGGNPAAVVPLDAWLSDATMQAIAGENNLAETAFFISKGESYHLRWFTPTQEVDLCGHATLATAFALYECLEATQEILSFQTRSGLLTVKREDGWLIMDFPARPPKADTSILDLLTEATGQRPQWGGKSRDYIAVFPDEATVHSLKPDMRKVAALDSLGLIVTAKGDQFDFVSRFFAPQAGVPEDPVTGSAHATLIPYWAGELGKSQLIARQISPRGGTLRCEYRGERVYIAGQAALYLRGEISV